MTETEQIKGFEKLAVMLAKRHAYKFPQLTFQECRQAAMVGVFYAVRSKERRVSRALTSYVYNCIKNYLFDELRQHCMFHYSTEFKYDLKFLPLRSVDKELPVVEDEETKAAKENTITRLFKLAKKLPSSNYEIFRMYYRDGYTDKEIAEVVDIRYNVVKSKRRRSTIRIKEML